MSKCRRVKVYSSSGSKCYHLPPSEIRIREKGGLIAFHKPSQQWREVLTDKTQTKLSAESATSSATITWMEVRAYVGEFGEKAQRIAAAKINAWPTVHDDRAVVISAGHVHQPSGNHDERKSQTLDSDAKT